MTFILHHSLFHTRESISMNALWWEECMEPIPKGDRHYTVPNQVALCITVLVGGHHLVEMPGETSELRPDCTRTGVQRPGEIGNEEMGVIGALFPLLESRNTVKTICYIDKRDQGDSRVTSDYGHDRTQGAFCYLPLISEVYSQSYTHSRLIELQVGKEPCFRFWSLNWTDVDALKTLQTVWCHH